MKFSQLYRFIVEKDEKPGQRYHSAKNSAGPASYVSGPVGKSDNFELSTPSERWEFDSSQIGDIGSSKSSSIYNTFFNSFALLANDSTFTENFNKIVKRFGESRMSYNHNKKIVDEFGEEAYEKYDYETKLHNLEFLKNKRTGQITEMSARIEFYQRRINLWNKYHNSNLQKNRLEVMYAGLAATVKKIEDQQKKSPKKGSNFFELKKIMETIAKREESVAKLNHELILTKSPKSQERINKDIEQLTSEISKLQKDLNSAKFSKDLPEFKKYVKYLRKYEAINDKFIISNLDETTVNGYAKLVIDYTAKLTEHEESLTEISNELESLYQYIDKINEINEGADRVAQDQLAGEVMASAKRILDDVSSKSTPPLTSLSQLPTNWTKIANDNATKIKMLTDLTSTDVNTNPILGYLDKFQQSYDSRDYIAERQLDKNTNITSLRDFERLPFSVLLNIYKAVRVKPMAIKSKEYDNSKDVVWEELAEYLDAFKRVRGDALFDSIIGRLKSADAMELIPYLRGSKIRDVWTSKHNKDFIARKINDSGLPESYKNRAVLGVMAKTPYRESNGGNSFTTLRNSLSGDIKRTTVATESFDTIASKILKSSSFDANDFKLDTMEVLELLRKHK